MVDRIILHSRDALLGTWFDGEVVSEKGLHNLFILINKYYPSYLNINGLSFEVKKWEDFLLYDFVYEPNQVNYLCFKIPVYIQDQDGKLILKQTQEEGIEIIYGIDGLDSIYCLGIEFRAYVYFDRHLIDGVYVDQSLAATKNRKILSDFLQEAEKLLDSKIVEVDSEYYGENHSYIYNYGIKEHARLLI